MRTDRVSRLLKLVQTLQSGRPQTVDELSKTVNVDRRTVFRDLKVLRDSGIDYVYDRTAKKYSATEGGALPPVTLSPKEALSLLMVTRAFLETNQIPDQESATSAAIKIESMLPKNIQDFCGTILNHTTVSSPQISDCQSITDIIYHIQHSLQSTTKIKITYDSYHDQKQIRDLLSPYRLMYIHRGWYVVALSELFNELRTYKLERFITLSNTNDHYQIPDDFSIEEYFGNAWIMIKEDKEYHVVIRFLPKVANNVAEIAWHKTQEIEFHDDGSIIFHVNVNGLHEISWWILGYGDQAEVIEPPELKQLIANHVKICMKHTKKN